MSRLRSILSPRKKKVDAPIQQDKPQYRIVYHPISRKPSQWRLLDDEPTIDPPEGDFRIGDDGEIESF